jgi:Family of unknown function (DUF6949)
MKAAAIASAARKLRDFHPANLERTSACALMPVLCRCTNQTTYRTAEETVSVNLLLIMPWRSGSRSARCFLAKGSRNPMVGALQGVISTDVVESLFAIAFGFAFAGLCASGSRLVGIHVPSFRMLEAGPMVGRLAAVPLLIFSAPYLIMRNTLRPGSFQRRRGEVVMVATVIAGLRSLMSGTVVVMAVQALLSV